MCALLSPRRGRYRPRRAGADLPGRSTPISDATRTCRISGVFLGSREMQWFLDHYCPDLETRTSSLVSPLRAADLSGLPRTVVVVGGHDPLLDEGVEYAERLRASGVPVELLQFRHWLTVSCSSRGSLRPPRRRPQTIVRAAAALLENEDAKKNSTTGGVRA
ncbi:alpha/beta hydrolase fold domain-containing protein [Rhodococcus hoagii]|nr:alpha/beta hydrolase fold domain-containing protein [Prescottella equi]